MQPTPLTIQNNVEQAPVHVTADVNFPDRETVTEVERNEEGDILRSVSLATTKKAH